MTDWPTGPEARARVQTWCALHGTTASRLASQCTPPVARSTLGRWAAGAALQRGTWERLTAQMDAMDRKLLDYLLVGPE